MRLMLMRLFVSVVAVFIAAGAASAQSARLDFGNLRQLEDRASDIVEVNIEGKMLGLAKRVLTKVDDKDAKLVGEAIKDLEGIYVRVLRFENDNEYDAAEVDAIRMQLQAPGWEKLANIRSRKNNQKIDVYTMFSGEKVSGVAVLLSEKRSIALVNVIGPIDIDLLAELSGKLNIPKMEIEKTSEGDEPK
ncbi:MAG: DUF4252 domain-containing protein [Pyrinomonadaceae bacterium]